MPRLFEGPLFLFRPQVGSDHSHDDVYLSFSLWLRPHRTSFVNMVFVQGWRAVILVSLKL
ncbi:unnamed protein product [Chondrus crispus]|uniref:Uncharacterized protein n=1 Tax=Chondrus crispus TaxID=2769 RepID=R7QSD8_CHOCR|nr:unnamed protein product [Chondrus crispus]CDF40305.1 unnamed protein product [Chondrus crispus]|eukprot:XP_005710599.1 unnamed protein product [Chondrus crispus]